MGFFPSRFKSISQLSPLPSFDSLSAFDRYAKSTAFDCINWCYHQFCFLSGMTLYIKEGPWGVSIPDTN